MSKYSDGWRPCEFYVMAEKAVMLDPKKGERGTYYAPWKKRKGLNKCNEWVSPEEIKKNGVHVCSEHIQEFKKRQKREAEAKRKLRAKYDPGPLPLDGE